MAEKADGHRAEKAEIDRQLWLPFVEKTKE
jgi:hypothetical protein